MQASLGISQAEEKGGGGLRELLGGSITEKRTDFNLFTVCGKQRGHGGAKNFKEGEAVFITPEFMGREWCYSFVATGVNKWNVQPTRWWESWKREGGTTKGGGETTTFGGEGGTATCSHFCLVVWFFFWGGGGVVGASTVRERRESSLLEPETVGKKAEEGMA